MHCSICKAPNHNKKGHHKHVNDIQNEQAAKQVEEDFDDPGIVANIMPHTVRPFLDPTQTPDSMVFMMQEQERFVYPRVRDFGPLPESNFIANAREEIPPPRMTTAMTRGRIRRGGTAPSGARGGNAASGHNARGGGASNVARGGGDNARGGASNEQERFVYPRVRDFGPLPESNFIANAREEIPPPRMTTAMTRGRIRRGGTAASRARGGNAASGHNARGGGASNVARGGGHNARGGASNVAGGGGHNTSAGGGHNARGGGGHNARGGNIARGGGGHNARGGGNVARGGGGHNATGANVARGARAAAPGFYNLRFGDDGSSRTWTEATNFMQAEEEVLITQNAPDDEWPHDFLSQ
nr:circumsporozoite protein-like [Aegilops tauschii subsp. strangulata]